MVNRRHRILRSISRPLYFFGKFLLFSGKKIRKKIHKKILKGEKVRKKTKGKIFGGHKKIFKKNFGERKKLKEKDLQNKKIEKKLKERFTKKIEKKFL